MNNTEVDKLQNLVCSSFHKVKTVRDLLKMADVTYYSQEEERETIMFSCGLILEQLSKDLEDEMNQNHANAFVRDNTPEASGL